MWLLVATAPKCFCGNRCACLPLCLSPGARLRAEADAPSQRERGGCWRCGRSGRIGGWCVPSTAVPPAYCHAQQHLPTSHTVSAGEKQHYASLNITAGFHLRSGVWSHGVNIGNIISQFGNFTKRINKIIFKILEIISNN